MCWWWRPPSFTFMESPTSKSSDMAWREAAQMIPSSERPDHVPLGLSMFEAPFLYPQKLLLELNMVTYWSSPLLSLFFHVILG